MLALLSDADIEVDNPLAFKLEADSSDPPLILGLRLILMLGRLCRLGPLRDVGEALRLEWYSSSVLIPELPSVFPAYMAATSFSASFSSSKISKKPYMIAKQKEMDVVQMRRASV